MKMLQVPGSATVWLCGGHIREMGICAGDLKRERPFRRGISNAPPESTMERIKNNNMRQ
jgi:hypothetical protein